MSWRCVQWSIGGHLLCYASTDGWEFSLSFSSCGGGPKTLVNQRLAVDIARASSLDKMAVAAAVTSIGRAVPGVFV